MREEHDLEAVFYGLAQSPGTWNTGMENPECWNRKPRTLTQRKLNPRRHSWQLGLIVRNTQKKFSNLETFCTCSDILFGVFYTNCITIMLLEYQSFLCYNSFHVMFFSRKILSVKSACLTIYRPNSLDITKMKPTLDRCSFIIYKKVKPPLNLFRKFLI